MNHADPADTASFDYPLPPDRIAQEPIEPRDQARLLVDRAVSVDHRRVADLPDELGPGDLVVVNETRVIPARLELVKPTGGRVEVLLLEPADGDPHRWQALVRGGRRVAPGTGLLDGDGRPVLTVGEPIGGGRRWVRTVEEPGALMARAGRIPLPPYITRPLGDDDRYQTMFARRPGSVAAPTAGLHLTTGVLDRIRVAGAGVVAVDLRVGLGTFRPIATDRVADHIMHAERYTIRPEVWDRIQGADRVVAVGTTVVRTLEAAAATGRLADDTRLFITRDHPWRVVDVLLTNFHVPRSSLLVLVDAFTRGRWRDLYREALAADYRFLSFGDAMLLTRARPEDPRCPSP
ncbi:MAG: tRNA preQ1(34) S-adenosylmethionine ribosyltransferase-isomerase QueA [Acidimicrobiales bacterium]